MKQQLADIKATKVKLAVSRQTKAISSKNQKAVDKFVKHNLDYDMLVNENDCREDAGKPSPHCENKQALAYDKAADIWEALPMSERKNLVKTHEYLTLGDF